MSFNGREDLEIFLHCLEEGDALVEYMSEIFGGLFLFLRCVSERRGEERRGWGPYALFWILLCEGIYL